MAIQQWCNVRSFLLVLFSVGCGEPQSHPYAVENKSAAPVRESISSEPTPFASLDLTATVNSLQTGKLILNSKAKRLQQLMIVPSRSYRVEASYKLDGRQKLERHFRQTGWIAEGKQLFDMLVVVSASEDLNATRAKITPMLTDIFSTLVNHVASNGGREIDWRLALVSADGSDEKCLVISKPAALQTLEFDDFVVSDDERVISKASAALGLDSDSMCAGFPRANAPLVVLAISDKDHQCDMDNPFDGSGKRNTRAKQTSFHCGSSLTRFHSKLKRGYSRAVKLYALLDNESSCGRQRAKNVCYASKRKALTSDCLFTNPCYDRDDSYQYTSANYRRAGIFDLIMGIGASDYDKLASDFAEDIIANFLAASGDGELGAGSPFIIRFNLGAGVDAKTVAIKVDGKVLPPKFYQVTKDGQVQLRGDVRKYFPAGSVAVVKYSVKRSYKYLRLVHRGDVTSLRVSGVNGHYDFNAADGLLVFDDEIPLQSEIRLSYEHAIEVSDTDIVEHRAHIYDKDEVNKVECCATSDCTSKFACQMDDEMVVHNARQQNERSSFTARYTFANIGHEFTIPPNCEESSMSLKLNGVRCSKLAIIEDSVKLTTKQAKDNCQMLNNYEADDDIELHYTFGRQDDEVAFQHVPGAEMRVKVNGELKTPVTDYIISANKINFTEVLPTEANVKVHYTP